MTAARHPLPDHDDYTDALCDRDPDAQQVRALLYRMHAEHDRLVWDSHASAAARVFQVDRRDRDGRLRHTWRDVYTQLLDLACERNGGDVGNGLQLLADAAEDARGMLGVLAGLDPLRDAIADPGWTFHGYGVRAEAWTVHATGPDDPTLRGYADEHRLHQHPRRQELRFHQLACRDGHLWWLHAPRGADRVQVWARRADTGDDFRIAGNLANGLQRMTNAVVKATHAGPVMPRGLRRDPGDPADRNTPPDRDGPAGTDGSWA